MIEYSMYLGINDGEEGFILPVLPEQIKLSVPGNNKTFEVINLGEVNVIKRPKLAEINFKSFFPITRAPYVSSEEIFPPKFYINKINQWRQEKQKIRFIFVGESIDINELVSIEDFEYYENAGEVGDIYFEVKLKKYVPYSAKKVIIQSQSSTQSAVAVVGSAVTRPSEKTDPNSYTILPGDTLFKIAKKFKGDGAKWRELAALNKIENPDMIYAGDKIKLS